MEYSLHMLNEKNNEGNTVLHLSVLDNSIELVEYLLDKGVDLNIKNKDGDTPLHLAIKLETFPITKLLLDHKAKLDVFNKNNETPVDLAKVRIIFYISFRVR